MKAKWSAAAVLAVLAVAAQAQAPTRTFTIGKGACQTSVKAPTYFCFAPMTDAQGETETLGIYVKLNPDGTFSNGHISASPLYNHPPSFYSTNWAGSNFSGPFSGTNPDGSTFSGEASIVFGQVKSCNRSGCQYQYAPVRGSLTLIE
jgi:hypothetical protein